MQYIVLHGGGLACAVSESIKPIDERAVPAVMGELRGRWEPLASLLMYGGRFRERGNAQQAAFKTGDTAILAPTLSWQGLFR